jgi:hypothetical protein
VGDWIVISQLQSLFVILAILTVTMVAGGLKDGAKGDPKNEEGKRLSDVL